MHLIHFVVFLPAALFIVTLVLLVYARKKQNSITAKLKKSLQNEQTAFLRNMTHELRTPLNGVMGMSDLMRDTCLDLEQSDYLETIRTSSEILLSIINDILDMALLNSGKFKIAESPVKLFKIIDSVYEQFYQTTKEKHIDFPVEFDPGIPYELYIDEARILQVLYRLVRNAIKFTNNGYVKIAVSTVPSSQVQEDVISVLFTVEDSGIGMDRKTINKVFKRFTQADNKDTRKFGGTGIGLTLCKEILSLMNSDLKVESEKGKGTRVSFCVSLKKGKASAAAAKYTQNPHIIIINNRENMYPGQIFSHLGYKTENIRDCADKISKDDDFRIFLIFISDLADSFSLLPQLKTGKGEYKTVFCLDNMNTGLVSGDDNEFYLQKPVTGKKLQNMLGQIFGNAVAEVSGLDKNKKILLAEDDTVNQHIFRRMLERLNCTIQLAENGKQAIEFFKTEQFDLVFLDSQMPEMSGSEAFAEIDKINKDKVPIIALTGMASDEDIQNFKKIGFNDFLAKPVKLKELADMVYKWVGKLQDDNDFSEFNSGEFLWKQNNEQEKIRRKISYFIFTGEQFFNNSEKQILPDEYLARFRKQAADLLAGPLLAALQEFETCSRENAASILFNVRLQYEKLKTELAFFMKRL